MLNWSKWNHGIPGAGTLCFGVMFLEQSSRFMQCCKACAIEVWTKTVSVTKHQDIVFFILALRTNCPVGPSVTKLFLNVTKLFLSVSLACLCYFFSSIVVTAQVPVKLLCIKKNNSVFIMICFSFCLPQHLILA